MHIFMSSHVYEPAQLLVAMLILSRIVMLSVSGASTVRSTVNAGGPLVKWKPANRPLMQEARRQQKQGKQQRQQGGKRQQNYAGRNQQVVQKPVNRRRVRTEPHSRLKPQLKSDSQQHSVLCPESEASTGNTALVEPVQPPKNKLRNLRKKLRQIDALVRFCKCHRPAMRTWQPKLTNTQMHTWQEH
eukprot:SAG11_NODE_205_length_12427_cov_8.010140_3_plen_187_part_00